MSWEDRHDVMTFAVLPTMARLFQRHEAAAEPTMTCATCHGDDGELVHYAMPRSLPALDPAHLPEANSADSRDAAIAKFMAEEVTPTMANLLGVPSLDPATRRGFSCFGCHPSVASR